MYYEYDDVYYQPCPTGYAVVQQPAVANEYISPDIVYVPTPAVAVPAQAAYVKQVMPCMQTHASLPTVLKLQNMSWANSCRTLFPIFHSP